MNNTAQKVGKVMWGGGLLILLLIRCYLIRLSNK